MLIKLAGSFPQRQHSVTSNNRAIDWFTPNFSFNWHVTSQYYRLNYAFCLQIYLCTKWYNSYHWQKQYGFCNEAILLLVSDHAATPHKQNIWRWGFHSHPSLSHHRPVWHPFSHRCTSLHPRLQSTVLLQTSSPGVLKLLLSLPPE